MAQCIYYKEKKGSWAMGTLSNPYTRGRMGWCVDGGGGAGMGSQVYKPDSVSVISVVAVNLAPKDVGPSAVLVITLEIYPPAFQHIPVIPWHLTTLTTCFYLKWLTWSREMSRPFEPNKHRILCSFSVFLEYVCIYQCMIYNFESELFVNVS